MIQHAMKVTKKILGTLLLTLLTSVSSAQEPKAGATVPGVEGSKPNIVIIFTDDQGYGDLSCYGSTTIRTPHLDKLASEGTRFTSFYAQPLCGPSRSALLTGRYPARSKGWEMPASEITFAERLKTAGYTTCCIGKWDVSSRRPIVPRMPNAKGFDYYWGPLGANDRGLVKLWENNTNIGEDKDMASLTRTYTDKACEWLEEHVAQNSKQEGEETGRKPFLLYLAHTMPHTIIDASPAFKNRSGNGLYADTIEELDHECGRLLDTIDRLGLRNDTLVIFTTDNGPWCNDQEHQHRKQEARDVGNKTPIPWSKGPEHAWGSAGPLREGKGSNYEGGVRVPCIVRWPGRIPAGRTSDAIFASLDFMPTFGALAGYKVLTDRVIDGVDQTGLLLGRSEAGNRQTYFYGSGDHGVRKGKWKLLKPGRKPKKQRSYPKDYGTNGIELYNLDNDIGEKHNLADQHPEIVEELMQLKLKTNNQ